MFYGKINCNWFSRGDIFNLDITVYQFIEYVYLYFIVEAYKPKDWSKIHEKQFEKLVIN